MAANTSPIFSSGASVMGGAVLTTAAADYTGQNINNKLVFISDITNGGFVQRLRFKALGTNVTTVARIYLTKGMDNLVSVLTAPAAPTGTPSTTGGTLQAGNYFAKIYAKDQYGKLTAAGTESAAVAITGTTGSIAWSWTAVTGAVSYIISVGSVTSGQVENFTSNTNSLSQTVVQGTASESILIEQAGNMFIAEYALPATTASATASTPDLDLMLNIALDPGTRIYVGLGTAVAAGWVVTTIAGKY